MKAYHIDRFGSIGGIVRRSAEDPRPGPKEVLMRVRASFILRGSVSVEQMSQYVARNYADHVLYFDQGYLGRADIIKDKSNYIRAWPTRSYTIVPGIRATCTKNKDCTVDGKITYDVRERAEKFVD
jgi:hypothetical protein